MSPEQILRMLEAQKGGCGVCRTPLELDRNEQQRHLSPFCVDRAADGVVRGFLCRACHDGLRGFGRDVERLQRAVEYLSRVDVGGEEREGELL